MQGNLISAFYRVRENLFHDIPAAVAIKNVRNAVNYEAAKSSSPAELRFLNFKMTNVCNSACEYCMHSVLNTRDKAEHVPLDIVLSVIEQAAGLNTHVFAINGGEPLTRPDIFTIISETVKHKILPVMMTNGLLLPDYWERLNDIGAWYIIISFDSLKKDIYEKQRGVSFERAMAGIHAAAALKRLNTAVQINVSVTLTRNNVDDIIETIKFMTDHGIAVQISPFHNYSPERFNAENSDIYSEVIEDVSQRLLDMKNAGYLISSSRGFIEHLPVFFKHNKRVPDGFTCKTGYTNLFIDTDMSVRPCWSSCFEPLGYAGRDSLKEMWLGEKMDIYRRTMMNVDCEGCWYMCTGEVEMFLEDKMD